MHATSAALAAAALAATVILLRQPLRAWRARRPLGRGGRLRLLAAGVVALVAVVALADGGPAPLAAPPPLSGGATRAAPLAFERAAGGGVPTPSAPRQSAEVTTLPDGTPTLLLNL